MKTRKLMAGVFVMALAVLSAVTTVRAEMIKGEVRKIDQAAGKITLKHGPIKSLDMNEGMTMVFRVREPDMLNRVKVGDKVQFEVERTASGISVTKIEKSR